MGRGWSVGAEWMYAWWGGRAHDRYWRTYGGDLEVRRYFGRRASEKTLAGHHLGLYGYSLPVCERLHFDFGIGIGYLGGEYETYDPRDGHYVWQRTRKLRWVGPTKAEVSLVWLIGNAKSK